MKLKNKKTGEIIDVYKSQVLIHFDGGKKTRQFKSLDELCKEWEDYKETKGFWVIEETGYIQYITNDMLYADYVNGEDFMACCKQIGNYFKTKEEAEKAVEKLKAWKRLKDMGFKFMWWKEANGMLDYNKIAFNHFVYNTDYKDQVRQDLDLLFGGEE